VTTSYSISSCQSCDLVAPPLSVLHQAGPGADPGHRHRLGAEGHLRHVREARQQSGRLQHAVSGGRRARRVFHGFISSETINLKRVVQVFRRDGGGPGERQHHPEGRPGRAAQHVQGRVHPHRTQPGERPAGPEGTTAPHSRLLMRRCIQWQMFLCRLGSNTEVTESLHLYYKQARFILIIQI